MRMEFTHAYARAREIAHDLIPSSPLYIIPRAQFPIACRLWSWGSRRRSVIRTGAHGINEIAAHLREADERRHRYQRFNPRAVKRESGGGEQP